MFQNVGESLPRDGRWVRGEEVFVVFADVPPPSHPLRHNTVWSLKKRGGNRLSKWFFKNFSFCKLKPVFRIRISLNANPDPGFIWMGIRIRILDSGFKVFLPKRKKINFKILKVLSFSCTFFVFWFINNKELIQNFNLLNSYKKG